MYLKLRGYQKNQSNIDWKLFLYQRPILITVAALLNTKNDIWINFKAYFRENWYEKTNARFILSPTPQACNFIKKETLTYVFSCEFSEIFKNIFFTEHIWVIASVI